MGRTLATYRMRLRKHQFFFHKLVKATKTPIQPYDEAWIAAHQLATAGSMVPYPKTPIVAGFAMVTKLFYKVQQVSNRFKKYSLNTFDKKPKKPKVNPKVIAENNPPIIPNEPKKAPFPTTSAQDSSTTPKDVISYLERWYLPYLPEEYRRCFKKALNGVKTLTMTREFFAFPSDEIVAILHLLIYDAYHRIDSLEKKADYLLSYIKQEAIQKESNLSQAEHLKIEKSRSLPSMRLKKETNSSWRSRRYVSLDEWLGDDSYES